MKTVKNEEPSSATEKKKTSKRLSSEEAKAIQLLVDASTLMIEKLNVIENSLSSMVTIFSRVNDALNRREYREKQ